MQLSNQFSEIVTPLLATTFNDVAGKSSFLQNNRCSSVLFTAQVPPDLAGTVQKEALYCSIGRCAQRLKDVIPFKEWLHQTLTAEAHSTSPMYAHAPVSRQFILRLASGILS